MESARCIEEDVCGIPSLNQVSENSGSLLFAGSYEICQPKKTQLPAKALVVAGVLLLTIVIYTIVYLKAVSSPGQGPLDSYRLRELAGGCFFPITILCGLLGAWLIPNRTIKAMMIALFFGYWVLVFSCILWKACIYIEVHQHLLKWAFFYSCPALATPCLIFLRSQTRADLPPNSKKRISIVLITVGTLLPLAGIFYALLQPKIYSATAVIDVPEFQKWDKEKKNRFLGPYFAQDTCFEWSRNNDVIKIMVSSKTATAPTKMANDIVERIQKDMKAESQNPPLIVERATTASQIRPNFSQTVETATTGGIIGLPVLILGLILSLIGRPKNISVVS